MVYWPDFIFFDFEGNYMLSDHITCEKKPPKKEDGVF